MPSPKDPNTPATPKQAQPTERQTSFLAIVMQNIKGKPEIDWEAVCKQADHKNAAVSKETYSQIQKKMGWIATPGGTASKSVGASEPLLSTTKVVKRAGKVGSKAPGMTGHKGYGKKATKRETKEIGGDVDYVTGSESAKALARVKEDVDDDEGF